MEKFPSLKYDSEQAVREKIEILRKGNKSKKLLDVSYRLQELKKLKAALSKYETEIHESNLKDLGQQHFTSFYLCLSLVKKEVDEVIENIHKWAAPRSVNSPVLLAPSKSYVIPEPFGVCLILSAWNSQYQTLIVPVAQAIAAGNVILAKPSEMAEASAVVCQKIFSELDQDIVQVCQGGAEVCIELLKNKFDIIVFTGSPQKGVLVARAAAEFLTPCILELGGQNPVIVDNSANIESTAKNLISGRCVIAGQACIAPEYVFVENSIYKQILDSLKTAVEEFYEKDPKKSKDYSRIINDFHANRLAKLLTNHNGKLIVGGEYDLKEKYISPTVVSFDSIEQLSKSPLAESEIFGPILYLAPYTNLDDCIDYINAKEKPLALYYFGNNSKNKEKIMKHTSSGAFVTNDCVVHFSNPDLPFGGVGTSGYSAYHGKWGFDNLSHLKPVMERSDRLVKLKYPPFTDNKKKIMTFLLNNCNVTQFKLVKIIGLFALIVVLYYFRFYFLGLFKRY